LKHYQHGNNDHRFQLWDIPRNETERNITLYAKGATACIVCVDVTRLSTFHGANKWISIIEKSFNIPIYIVITKIDLLSEEEVTLEHEIELKQFKEKCACVYKVSLKETFDSHSLLNKLYGDLATYYESSVEERERFADSEHLTNETEKECIITKLADGMEIVQISLAVELHTGKFNKQKI
jgi:GTPase SAR1 family protein